ncbi:hypothetical protein H6G00_09810 [Leptolyngbya sp. FACHB-541]|uniref:SH3 domain-containing protein n=1 Tax=Leptolyngbya sp. FACHB-541 TaxID=2692810 RepID=UPI001683AE6F|nr:SH3 domain-containing protein [Leptolyngbya sp. FACHB-541]MBD1996912.1 hypothetical protein [Leptolyngbya sp. FACHB-541]
MIHQGRGRSHNTQWLVNLEFTQKEAAVIHPGVTRILLTGAIALTGITQAAWAIPLTSSPQPEDLAQVEASEDNITPAATPSEAAPSDLNGTQLLLTDQTEQSPEFSQFLSQVQQAVRDRNADFMRSIITPYTLFGDDGDLVRFENFNLDSPTDPFWFYMERALSDGCVIEANNLQPVWEADQTWLCPIALSAFDAALAEQLELDQPSITPYEEHVVVIGQDVSVRTQPNINSPVIQTLSNEIVRLDRQTFQAVPFQSQAEIFSFNNPVGWIPVILPDGQNGYVSTQNAYQPIGTRVTFAEVEGVLKLQMLTIVD